MSFNGYIVTFFNHETQDTETEKFLTKESVMERGFEEFPDAETFAENLFQIYGDYVKEVVDNDGSVLFENEEQYNEVVAEWSYNPRD